MRRGRQITTPGNTRPDLAAFGQSLWESTRHKWRRYPERIVIVAAASPEDLPNPFDAMEYADRPPELSETTSPTVVCRCITNAVMCRFTPNASRQQIADQQSEMLSLLLPRGPVVWAAYWGDSEDAERIWVVGVPGREGTLSTLYAHLRAEIASKTGTAKPQAWKKGPPATIARAKFVEKVLNELKTIHPKMHNESCFEQVAANHSGFSIFKIARTDVDVKRWIENIQERRDLVKLAQEIAARHFKKSKDTLATDWSHRKKLRKKGHEIGFLPGSP